MVLEMRDMIKALQDDCRSLAGAITQLTSPGADVGAVLQALPPTLVQVGMVCAGVHDFVVWMSCRFPNTAVFNSQDLPVRHSCCVANMLGGVFASAAGCASLRLEQCACS
jgi:hypothetical protein